MFDGTSAPYSEDDETNPLNDYGLSKLEAEKCVISANSSECLDFNVFDFCLFII